MSGSFPLSTLSVTPTTSGQASPGNPVRNMDVPRSPVLQDDATPGSSDASTIPEIPKLSSGTPLSSISVTPSVSSSSTYSSVSSKGKDPAYLRSSKRSSSTSNDSLYERDRFRARLQNFNTGDDSIDESEGSCDVCDIIGSKTTKLNVRQSKLADPVSPLNASSEFFKSLNRAPISGPGLIKNLQLSDLEAIFEWYFNRPLPKTQEMFPWLHGLHADNFAQRLFFMHQQRQRRKTSIFDNEFLISKPNARFLMTINADILSGPDLALKNSTALSEILCPIDTSRAEVGNLIESILYKVYGDDFNDEMVDLYKEDAFKVNYLPMFLDLDPDRGVSLRNFHIQVSKLAICSDFIVSCFDEENLSLAHSIARLVSLAQKFEEVSLPEVGQLANSSYNTFLLTHFKSVAPDDRLFSVTLKKKIPSKNYDLNRLVNLSLKFLQNWDTEYVVKEKIETIKMSSASKLNGKLFSGNSWDYQNFLNFTYSDKKEFLVNKKRISINNLYCNPLNSITTTRFNSENLIETILPLPNLDYKLFINCFNDAGFPDRPSLENLLKGFQKYPDFDDEESNIKGYYCLSFPSSGSIGMGDIKHQNIVSMVNTCKLVYLISKEKGLDCLIYCSDGYTELSLLTLMYIIYSTNSGLNDSIIKLHLEYGRPFYLFDTDIQILRKLEPILRNFSPLVKRDFMPDVFEDVPDSEINEILLSPKSLILGFKLELANNSISEYQDNVNYSSSSSSSSSLASSESSDDTFTLMNVDWCKEVDGSLPSRILPYLYLGSLKHANCLPLLKELGIKKVISVGEPLDWINGSAFQRHNDIIVDEFNGGDIEVYNILPRDKTTSELLVDQVMKVNNLQDDGIAQLETSLPKILGFIDNEYKASHGQTRILVHCRVGVSRSATVVIAEVMRRLKINLPKAYLYVRVRRLNIIIQPNLKFMYELFKWEETNKQDKSEYLREIDWFAICREITTLNNPYL